MGIPSAPENNQQTAISNFDVTADATFPVLVAAGTIEVESVYAVFQASIATSAAATVSMSLVNLGTDGAGTTVVAGPTEVATAGNAVTALKPVAMSVVAAAQQLTVGQCLGFKWDEATTDVADASITVSCRYTQTTAPAQT